MQFDTTYLTEAGRSLATGTLGGLDKIQFTRAVASSHDYSATPVNDLKKLTSIEDVQQTVDYSRIIKKDDTTLTMRVDFPSKDVTTAYSLYTVGFYARPENGDEILYGVLPSSLPDYIAAYDGKSNLNDSFQTDTTVSDADNVLITVSQAGSLNEADLDAIFASKHIATIDDIKANIPDTVIDGSKPADFKEAVTLEKGAVDGAGNAIATTKNLADGDATTLKAAKAYADTQASDKVKTANTDNWQKTKVTGDDGGNKYSFTTANTTDLVAAIQALPLGYHTFYCQAGVQGNPSSQAVRGIAEITTAGANPLGVGYLTDSTGAFWSFYVDSSVLKLKRSADVDSIDPSVIVKTTLTATDDVLNLADGTYRVWQVVPKNLPAIGDGSGSDWGYVTVKSISAGTRWVEYTNIFRRRRINVYSGSPATWSGWYMPNEDSLALDANVVHRNPDTGVVSEPVDFTKLTVNGGKSVATSDDLKSLEASAWLSLGMPKGSYLNTTGETTTTNLIGEPLYMKFDSSTGITTLSGGLLFSPSQTLSSRSTWSGELVTLPNGFDIYNDDLKEFILLLLSNSTSTTFESVSKNGKIISGSIIYQGGPVGYKDGISVIGSVGANYRQYITNLTTKLIKKV